MSDDDEGEVLIRGKPAFMGLKFKDEEQKVLAMKIMFVSLGQLGLCFLLLIMHLLHEGFVSQIVVHIVIAALIPFFGYLGVQQNSARWMYIFEIGNVQFAIIHLAIWMVLYSAVDQLEQTDPEQECRYLRGQGRAPSLRRCEKVMLQEKEEAPALLFWWTLISFPLWVAQIVGAAYGHEYYFRLRVEKLVMRPTGRGDAMGTVVEEGEYAGGGHVDDIDGDE